MRSATSRAACLACNVADVSACGLGELCGAALDRLLLRANRQGGHPPALQGQHAPVADHLPRDGERFVRCHLSGGLLQHDRAQVALLEDGVLLGQLRLDAILDRALGRRRSDAPIRRTASSGPNP